MAESDPNPVDGLDALRRQIDETDRQLLALVNRRAELAGKVGELKQHHDAPVYRPEREAQIMRRLRGANPGPLPGDAIEAIWREIVSGCRELERRVRVAFLGPVGNPRRSLARSPRSRRRAAAPDWCRAAGA